MPHTTKNGNPGLLVNFISPPGWTFAPGDTVIGTVVRHSCIVSPEATVTIALIGRVKTKIHKSSGNSSAQFRERKQLFGPPTTSQVLCRGPLHLPPKEERSGDNDLLSWPFSITIPTQSKEEVGKANRTLPGTFYSSNLDSLAPSEGFVEYYLEAQLRYNRRGSFEILKSTCPITLRRFPGTSLLSYNMKKHTVDRTFCSPRLLPGMENADLTMKQKAQKFFGSSKVPELHYKAEMSWPCSIQLDNPSHFPFILNIIPQQEKSCAGIRGVGHEIRLTSIRMCIKGKTTVTAPGKFSKHSFYHDNQSSRYDLQIGLVLKDLESPIIFSSEKENKPVNFGNLFQLVLRSDGLTAGKRRLSKISDLYPSFSITGITHSHWLDIDVILSVVGEIHTIQLRSALKILPPG